MTATLQVPAPWAVTDRGISCEGIHALDWQLGFDGEDGTVVLRAADGEHRLEFDLEEDDPVAALADEVDELACGLHPETVNTVRELIGDLYSEGIYLRYLPTALAPRTLADLLGVRPGTLTNPVYPELNRVDIAAVMEHGDTEPRMLIEGLLVEGEPHLWYGAKGTLKTWLLVHAVKTLIQRGQTVIWVDMEMARRDVAHRLILVGLTPEEVAEHLVYLEFPNLDLQKQSVEQWEKLLAERQPALIGVDAHQDVLAIARLNENTSEINRWTSTYLQPALALGATTVLLDHTGHDDAAKHARGSSSKGQVVRIEMAFSVVAPATKESVGIVTLSTEKNAVAARLPEKQTWLVGGPDDAFTLELMAGDPMPQHPGNQALDSRPEAVIFHIQRNQLKVLQEEYPDGLTLTKLRSRAGGNAERNRDAALGLLANGSVRIKQNDRGWDEYFYVPPTTPAEAPPAEAPPAPPATSKLSRKEKVARAQGMATTGSTYAEIADALGVTEPTVRRWLA